MLTQMNRVLSSSLQRSESLVPSELLELLFSCHRVERLIDLWLHPRNADTSVYSDRPRHTNNH